MNKNPILKIMANAKIDKLRKQLELYSTQIDKYEKAFLANDGKIDEKEQNILDSIRVLLDKINAKLDEGREKALPKETEGIPNAFQKGFAQIKLATDKLLEKVEELKGTDKMELAKDKLLLQIEKIQANIPKLEASFSNSNESVVSKCQGQLDTLKNALNSIKNKLDFKPISFEEKAAQAKTQIQAIMARVETIKTQFS